MHPSEEYIQEKEFEIYDSFSEPCGSGLRIMDVKRYAILYAIEQLEYLKQFIDTDKLPVEIEIFKLQEQLKSKLTQQQ